MTILSAMIKHQMTAFVGLLFGFVVLGSLYPLWAEKILDLRDQVSPVITDWKITSAVEHGNDLILKGTMKKHRDCLHVPPPVARDSSGDVFPLTSILWAPKDAKDETQSWGPWIITDGAGRGLQFSMVYICAGSRPNIAIVGVYIPRTARSASGVAISQP